MTDFSMMCNIHAGYVRDFRKEISKKQLIERSGGERVHFFSVQRRPKKSIFYI